MAMNAAAVQGSDKAALAGDAQPTRPLWQVPLFLVGVGVLTSICLTRPLGGDIVNRQLDSELREVRKLLNRPELDAAQAEKTVDIASRALQRTQTVPNRAGEAHYLQGLARARLALILNNPTRVEDSPRVVELWHAALEDFDAALNLSVPDSDRGRLNYRRAQAGFYTDENPVAVATRLQESAEMAEDKAEAYGLLVQAWMKVTPPRLKEALAANEKLRLVPPPVSEEVLATARLQGGQLLLNPDWPTRDANDRLKRVEEACKVLENVKPPAAPAEVVLEARVLRGQCYMDLNRWAEAGILWQKLLDENGPTWSLRGKVLYLRGRCYCKVDPPQLKEALAAWQECAEGHYPNHAVAADLARAELQVQERHLDQVLPALERALQGVNKPTEWTNPLVSLKRLDEQFETTLTVLSKEGAYDIALHVAEVYARVAPPGRAARLRGDLSAEWARGWRTASACWLIRQDDGVRALLLRAGSAYKAAADEAAPADPSEALWLAAGCLLEAGDANATLAVLQHYLEQKDPQPAHAAEAYARLGELLSKANRVDEAENAYRACIACPGFPPTFALRARCRVAEILMLRGKVDQAEQILEENIAAAQGEDDVEIIEETCFALGNIYFNRRQYNEAKTWLAKAPAQVRNLRAALRAHYQLAESYRYLAIKAAQLIESQKRSHEEAIAQNRQGLDNPDAIRITVALHKDMLKKAEAEYQWVQDNLARVPAAERTLTPDEQAQVPFVRADCLFYMEKYGEAQAVYEEQVAYYTKCLQDSADADIVAGPAGVTPNVSRHPPDGGVATGIDRGLARWAAARRRLDAKGGVLRCLAVQGRREQVQQLDAEIRRLLVDMDEKVRGEWEAWLKLATDARAVP
jgi:tetratricopeptide (TPR) repeat protein